MKMHWLKNSRRDLTQWYESTIIGQFIQLMDPGFEFWRCYLRSVCDEIPVLVRGNRPAPKRPNGATTVVEILQ